MEIKRGNASSVPPGSGRIMIVDDDRDFVDGLCRILERRGFQVVSAHDTEKALGVARQHNPEVALLDIRLGHESGVDLIAKLKEILPDVVCVMVTAYAELETAIQAMEHGANQYLRKPVNPVDLLATLDRCFEVLTLHREKRELERKLRQSQKLDAVGRLATGVAHDFNNSLTAIAGFAECVRLSLPAAHRASADIDGIMASVEQAAGVTEGLLTFSRESVTEIVPLDLGRLVYGSSRMLGRMLPASIVMTIDSTESSADLWIRGDQVQLNQVLINVVVNARDAMPEGGRLRIEVKRESIQSADVWAAIADKGSDVIRLTVEDDGCGMPQDVLDGVFEPFFTTKARGQGTGLGMSIVHGIVESHHGRLHVESEEGGGTRITMLFPRCEPSVDSDVAASRPAELNGHGTTILVADDNEHVRTVIATLLKASGYVVLQAEDGKEALRVFEDQGDVIELAILDIDMPEMNGAACMKSLRALRPALPIILITGLQGNPLLSNDLDGALFLRKPFSMVDLTRLVGETLCKAPAARD